LLFEQDAAAITAPDAACKSSRTYRLDGVKAAHLDPLTAAQLQRVQRRGAAAEVQVRVSRVREARRLVIVPVKS